VFRRFLLLPSQEYTEYDDHDDEQAGGGGEGEREEDLQPAECSVEVDEFGAVDENAEPPNFQASASARRSLYTKFDDVAGRDRRMLSENNKYRKSMA
jgi:hypothetical protein